MLNPTPQFTNSADGTRIAYYDLGGEGPELLLGHATGFCALVWAPVLEHLKHRFHCFAYDLRGHGLSSSPGPQRSHWEWDRYADDAAAVIAAAGLTKPFSVGHSSGAATALLLEQAQPGTFEALVGFEPVMFDADPPIGPDENRDLAVRALNRRREFDSRDAALSNFAERGPFTRLHPDALAAYVDYGFYETDDGKWHLRCNPEDEAAVYVMASAHTGFVNLAKVQCPVLVVRGADSIAFDEATMMQVAERSPLGNFATMADAGHFGALEQPELFAQLAVQAFVPGVSGPR